MPANPLKRKCSATTAAGHPCKAYAIRDTNPPLCSIHARRNTGAGAPPGNDNAATHGFYRPAIHPDELADLADAVDSPLLAGEIACAKIALRRVLAAMDPDDDQLTIEQKAQLASLTLQAARTIGRLLRDQRALSGDAAAGIAGALGYALDELGTALGLPL